MLAYQAEGTPAQRLSVYTRVENEGRLEKTWKRGTAHLKGVEVGGTQLESLQRNNKNALKTHQAPTVRDRLVVPPWSCPLPLPQMQQPGGEGGREEERSRPHPLPQRRLPCHWPCCWRERTSLPMKTEVLIRYLFKGNSF